MSSLAEREAVDERSIGELFLYFSDEQSDLTWVQDFQGVSLFLMCEV